MRIILEKVKYTFTPGVAGVGKVTFEDVRFSFQLSQILLIQVVEEGKEQVLYQTGKKGLGGDLTGVDFVLEKDTSSLLALDEIQVIVERIESELPIDDFGKVMVAQGQNEFDAQLTYNLQPLLYETITSGVGATLTHSSNNRNAIMGFANTPTGGLSYLQTFEYYRYQPGRAQQILITFNLKVSDSNVREFAQYGDDTNAFGFRRNDDGILEFYILSGTDEGDLIVPSSQWDNQGALALLDLSKEQIFSVSFEALYTGSISFGFQIKEKNVIFHTVHNANATDFPYIQNANLPIRIGMEVTGVSNATKTMHFNCVDVKSSGGEKNLVGIPHTIEASVTAASGARTHALSVRPKLLFNGFENRTKFVLTSVAILVTGSNPVKFELAIGQAIATPTWADINTLFSAFEFGLGTISGSAALYYDTDYIPAANQVKGSKREDNQNRLPITLDKAGLQRLNGTLSGIVTGIGGASACRVSFNFKEIR